MSRSAGPRPAVRRAARSQLLGHGAGV